MGRGLAAREKVQFFLLCVCVCVYLCVVDEYTVRASPHPCAWIPQPSLLSGTPKHVSHPSFSLSLSPCCLHGLSMLLLMLMMACCRLAWEETLLDNLLNFAATPRGLLLLQQTGAINECVTYMFSRFTKKLQVPHHHPTPPPAILPLFFPPRPPPGHPPPFS